jgi:hypothetical protein
MASCFGGVVLESLPPTDTLTRAPAPPPVTFTTDLHSDSSLLFLLQVDAREEGQTVDMVSWGLRVSFRTGKGVHRDR